MAPLQDVNAQEKDTVTLEVAVNFEEISYRWLKNGVEIRSTDRCQARCRQRTHTLSIRNVHFGDSAEYTFVAGSARTSAKVYVEGETVACPLVVTARLRRSQYPLLNQISSEMEIPFTRPNWPRKPEPYHHTKVFLKP